MSLQSSTFKTSHVMDNEIAKANDFEFAFEQVVQNVSKATQMMLESRQDFIINGTVLPYSGMNNLLRERTTCMESGYTTL